MSIIAALLVLYAAQTGGAPMTAEQALAASREMTSIGPDPCRDPGTGEEIVVCARRESPYALPLYDSMAGQVASTAGGGRAEQMEAVRQLETACAKQGAFCYPPPLFNGGSVLRVLVKGVTKLIEGE